MALFVVHHHRCEAEVLGADKLGRDTMVRFRTTRTMRAVPGVVPRPGQNFYESDRPA